MKRTDLVGNSRLWCSPFVVLAFVGLLAAPAWATPTPTPASSPTLAEILAIPTRISALQGAPPVYDEEVVAGPWNAEYFGVGLIFANLTNDIGLDATAVGLEFGMRSISHDGQMLGFSVGGDLELAVYDNDGVILGNAVEVGLYGALSLLFGNVPTPMEGNLVGALTVRTGYQLMSFSIIEFHYWMFEIGIGGRVLLDNFGLYADVLYGVRVGLDVTFADISLGITPDNIDVFTFRLGIYFST